MALLVGTVLVTGLVQTVQATGSQARTPTGSRTATIAISGLTPKIPTRDDSVMVTGTVVNHGKSAITQAHLGVRIGPDGPLGTRSDMKSALSRSGFSTAQDGSEIGGHTLTVPDIPAGSSAPFSLKVPVSALHLDTPGVYQFGVTLDGRIQAEPYEHVLGIKRTFLPWFADGATAKPTQLTYLWPLTDRPHIAARGDTESEQSPIFLDDDLARELAPGGRLQQMVELAKQLPVTWVIDPDLLATVEAMLKNYRVAGPGDDVLHTTPGTGSAVARQWLDSLRTAVAGDEVIALPFGDPDLASVAHQGRKLSGITGQLHVAGELGKGTVDTILGGSSTSKAAWPVDGAIDPSIVSVARASGARTVIARSDTFHESGGLDYTPTAARPIGGGITAVVADAGLSTAFTGAMSDPAATDLAVQDFVAQTLLITMQAPQKQRSVVVAPQRTPTVQQATAMAEAITITDHGRWAQSADLSTAAGARPDPRASHHVPPASAYPASLRKHELPAQAFSQLHEDDANLANFVVILTIKDRVTVPFRNAMLRAMSTGLRGDPAGGKGFRDAIGRYLTDLIGAVHILDKQQLTLSGRSGTIPVTVKNDLGQPVTGLVLRLTSGTNIRLKIHDPDQPIAIGAGHTRTLKFQTTASANGPAQVTAHLYTQSGELYGSTVAFKVNITKVTDLVMLIIAAGLLLLVLAGVRIYRQRKRQAAEGDGGAKDGGEPDSGADDGADDGAGSGTGNTSDGGSSRDGSGDGAADSAAGTGGAGPGQPGDPAADTGQESPEPSSASERVDG